MNKADEGREQNNNIIMISRTKSNNKDKNNRAVIFIYTSLQVFSEGKSPIQVAVALNVKESEITRFYKEYWKQTK